MQARVLPCCQNMQSYGEGHNCPGNDCADLYEVRMIGTYGPTTRETRTFPR